MRTDPEHIDAPILTGREKSSFTPMYSMHKYWSKKPSEIISKYIESYTNKGDIVLDTFSGSGVTIVEALKLGRKAIGIDLNPVADFITRVTLEPVNLSHLQWAFHDIEEFCDKTVSELFITKCSKCGKQGTIDFVVRHRDDPVTIGYSCSCSRERLFKDPDTFDRQMDAACAQMDAPFWYPNNVQLHTTRKKEYKYIHELFTKRNIIALSSILHAIEDIQDQQVRNVMRLTFSAALDKSSRLKPLSKQDNKHYTLQEGWIAVRFYTPPMWQEVNPIMAFRRSFLRVYNGKMESNKTLLNAVIGSSFKDLESGSANVLLFQGPADEILLNHLPKRSVDYVLTDPPFGDAIQYLSLSAFWGAWLGLDFDYAHEIVIDTKRNMTREQYDRNLQSVFKEIGRVAKEGSYVHVFYNDIKGPYLHTLLNGLMLGGISPQRIIHQAPPSSFGTAVRPPPRRSGSKSRKQTGYFGSYIIRGRVTGDVHAPAIMPLFTNELRSKIAEAARQTMDIQNGETTVGAVLHSVYEQLDENNISTYANYNAEKFVIESVSEFAQLNNQGKLEYISDENCGQRRTAMLKKLRKELVHAESLFIDEEDAINRVRQLAERRLKVAGITAEIIRHVEIKKKIKPSKIRRNREKLFISLLSNFGRELGFRVKHLRATSNLLVWTNKNTLGCNFKLGEKNIRVSIYSPEADSGFSSELGTISYGDLILRLKRWCDDNPYRGNEIRKHLIGLEGQSLGLSTKEKKTDNGYSHVKFEVQSNQEWCPRHYLLKLKAPPGSKFDITPGQFFHIICDPDEIGRIEAYPLALRRPFSIHGADYHGFKRSLLARISEIPSEIREILERKITAIDILYKVVGEGTEILSRDVGKGNIIDAIGPCGKGFTLGSQQNALIVAGGIGIAPLVALAERLRYLDKKVYVYFGALNRDLLKLALARSDSIDLSYSNGTNEFPDIIRRDFREIGVDDVKVCTDDGFLGEKSQVTELLNKDLDAKGFLHDDSVIYTCGPYNMLRAVANIAKKYSIECQVLLEQRMACGIGTCLSCTCDMIDPSGAVEKKRVCIDGPVFNSDVIKWKD